MSRASENPQNVLVGYDRSRFRQWLSRHVDSENECWVRLKRGRPIPGAFNYLDAVEEALCFGWIDSVCKVFPEYGCLQRFSPRARNSHWTELNKARVQRLECLGLMTDAGRAVFPNEVFRIQNDLQKLLQEDPDLAQKFYAFPKLYQRVRLDSIQYQQGHPEVYERMKANFIRYTQQGRMYGQWNDWGRLTDSG